MKKEYIEAEIEITKFTVSSVVTTTSELIPGGPDLGDGDEYEW